MQKTNLLHSPAVAKHPDIGKHVLSHDELSELQRRVAQTGITAVQDFYRTAYIACRLDEKHFPNGRSVQELVHPPHPVSAP